VAGAKKETSSTWVTNGGRVLCAIGLGGDLNEAIKHAYIQKSKADWAGLLARTDIGKNQLTSPNAR
jgi:phosphoribosylamine--glycine ligase